MYLKYFQVPPPRTRGRHPQGRPQCRGDHRDGPSLPGPGQTSQDWPSYDGGTESQGESSACGRNQGESDRSQASGSQDCHPPGWQQEGLGRPDGPHQGRRGHPLRGELRPGLQDRLLRGLERLGCDVAVISRLTNSQCNPLSCAVMNQTFCMKQINNVNVRTNSTEN